MRGRHRGNLLLAGLTWLAMTAPLAAQQPDAPLGFAPPRSADPPHPDADSEKGRPNVARPAPQAVAPAPSPGQAALSGDPLQGMAGRWRFADARACASRYGEVEVIDGHLRFEWHLGDGRVNIAVERVDRVDGDAIYTTVLSDVGTPNSETGQRVRYVIGGDHWTSENLATHDHATHARC